MKLYFTLAVIILLIFLPDFLKLTLAAIGIAGLLIMTKDKKQ